MRDGDRAEKGYGDVFMLHSAKVSICFLPAPVLY